MKCKTTFGEVGMAVVIHGKEVGEFPHTDGKTYLWARNGIEYGIAAWNFTNRRVEVVITVDGLDIIGGKTGDYKTQTGYVINNHYKPEMIPGFRLDENHAAHFVFGAPEKSYAALTDRPNNIGVIGAAFFIEKQMPPMMASSPVVSFRGLDDDSLFCSMEDSIEEETGPSLGTAFGRETEFVTSKTHFLRETPQNPMAILELQYRTKEELQKMGVNLNKKQQAMIVAGSPNPFPGKADGCPPPAGWNPRG